MFYHTLDGILQFYDRGDVSGIRRKVRRGTLYYVDYGCFVDEMENSKLPKSQKLNDLTSLYESHLNFAWSQMIGQVKIVMKTLRYHIGTFFHEMKVTILKIEKQNR